MNTDLLIPYALNSQGKIVSPDNAKAAGEYFCPDCKERVYPRAGEIKGKVSIRRHFAHTPGVNHACGFETDIHLVAKHSLYFAIRDYLESNDSPVKRIKLLHKCNFCGHENTDFLPRWAASVELESCLFMDGDSKRITDVAIWSNDKRKALAFEILATHAVDEMKASDLQNRNIGWYELAAKDVISNTTAIRPGRYWNVNFVKCIKCGNKVNIEKIVNLNDLADFKKKNNLRVVSVEWPDWSPRPIAVFTEAKE